MTTNDIDNSDDKWRAFDIHCRPETEIADIFIVTFNPKTPPDSSRSQQSNAAPLGAMVTVESGAGMLVAIEYKPPEVATPALEEHDYSEKAFETVRKWFGQQRKGP